MSIRPERSSAALVLTLGAALTLFFAPALLGAGDFVYRDTGRMHAPSKRWIAGELAQGRLPEWNPYAGLGMPVVASAQDAVLHPFGAVLLALPPAAAMKTWILLSFVLAAAGTFVWARALGLERAAAALAAVVFTFSGPLVSASDNVQFLTTYAALPWILAAAHGYARRGGPAALLGVGVAAAICAAAGDPQGWGLGVGLAGLAVAVAAAAPPPRRLGRAVAAALAATVLSAPFVLPVVEWLPHSVRAAGVVVDDADRWNLHPRRLLELLVPDLLRDDPLDPISAVFQAYAGNAATHVPWFLSVYVGASVIALAALGAATSRAARGLAALAVVFAWAALGPHAGFAAVAAHVPVLGAFRYSEKLAVWIPLLLAPAAALGATALARAERARAAAWIAGAGATVLLAVAGLSAAAPGVVAAAAGGAPEVAARLAANLVSGAGRAGLVLALLALVAARVARGGLGRAAPVAVLALVAVDLFGGNAGAYVLGPPERPGRPPLAAGLPAGDRVFTPFTPRDDRWPELGRLGSKREWDRRTLAAFWNVPLRIGTHHDYVALRDARWAAVEQALEGSGRLAHLGLFGFAHVVVPGRPDLAARTGAAPPFEVEASDPELPAFLVGVPHRPRAYVALAPFAATGDEALTFARSGGADGRTAVEGPVPAGAGAAGDAALTRDEPGDTAVRVRATGRALLVLNDLFAPGWTATVDGRPAPIVRTNAVVRGVWVEPGAHEVRFRYRTPGLAAGWGVALGGLAVLAAWALSVRLAGRRAARRRTLASA